MSFAKDARQASLSLFKDMAMRCRQEAADADERAAHWRATAEDYEARAKKLEVEADGNPLN